MWAVEIRREELGDVLQKALQGNLLAASRVSLSTVTRPGLDGIILLWAEPPQETRFLPTIIVVEDTRKHEFFAWVGTYFQGLRPISRLTRVVEWSQFKQIIARNEAGPPKGKYIGAASGLVIAEALLRIRGKRGPVDLTFEDCASTFAFAFSQALLSGATSKELRQVARAWKQVERCGLRAPGGEQLEVLAAPCTVLASLCGRDLVGFGGDVPTVAYNIAVEISEGGAISPRLVSEFAESLSIPLPLLRSIMEGTRESRVVGFEEAMVRIGRGTVARGDMAMFGSGLL